MRASSAASDRLNHAAPRRSNLPENTASRAVFRQLPRSALRQNTLPFTHFRIVHGRLSTNEGELARPVDGNEEVELSVGGLTSAMSMWKTRSDRT
jgi:hypothetical protein